MGVGVAMLNNFSGGGGGIVVCYYSTVCLRSPNYVTIVMYMHDLRDPAYRLVDYK